MITVSRATAFCASYLRKARIPTPHIDAMSIVGSVCNLSREHIITHPDHELSVRQAHRITELVTRRCSHEPLAYLVGYKWFFGLKLIVSDSVLIPRPDTETLVTRALEIIRDTSPLVWDIGTGSGAIACAIGTQSPHTHMWASDVSREALKVARANIRVCAPHVKLFYSDLAQTLPPPLRRASPTPILITANLPYIRSRAWKSLMPEVREYEPKQALVAGPDGLRYYKKLVRQLMSTIANRPTAALFEIDPFQYRLLTAWIKKNKLPLFATRHRDLSGRTRVIELTNAQQPSSHEAHS